MEKSIRKWHKCLLCSVLLICFKIISLEAQRPPPNNVNVENFTTCHEFLNNTHLDVDKIVGIDWKIFYFWNYKDESSYVIRFQLASPSLVNRFKIELDEDLKPPVNWKNAHLFMETTIDFSALYVKTNTSGMYQIIPTLAFQANTDMPLMIFGLKLVEPEGYLGIMNCKYRLCYALAPVQKMPKPSQIPEAAAKLGFYSTYGRAYNDHETPRTLIKPEEPPELDDSDDIEIHGDFVDNKLVL